MTSFNCGGKKAKDVGLTCRCHLKNVMSDSIYHGSMEWSITQFLFAFCLFVCFFVFVFVFVYFLSLCFLLFFFSLGVVIAVFLSIEEMNSFLSL